MKQVKEQVKILSSKKKGAPPLRDEKRLLLSG